MEDQSHYCRVTTSQCSATLINKTDPAITDVGRLFSPRHQSASRIHGIVDSRFSREYLVVAVIVPITARAFIASGWRGVYPHK